MTIYLELTGYNLPFRDRIIILRYIRGQTEFFIFLGGVILANNVTEKIANYFLDIIPIL